MFTLPKRKRLILASFNIYKKLNDSRTQEDFKDLLSVPGLDVAGLQEIDWNITEDRLPAGWGVHQIERPFAAKKDPIVYRDELVVQDQGIEFLHDEVTHAGKTAPARYAHWMVFTDHIFINTHFNADCEQPPGYPKSGSPRPRSNYRMLRDVIELANELQRKYQLPVFLSADFNVDFGADRRVRHRLFPYANLTKAGFKCCWENMKEESTRTKKPRTGRTIDQIWARGTKTHRVVFTLAYTPNRWGKNDPVESDHLAVIVHALIKQRLRPWLFNIFGKRR